MSEKISEIRPRRGGFVCFEAPGVEPVFCYRESAKGRDHLREGRIAHCHGEIRVYNAACEIEESIPFDERNLR